MNRPVPPPGGHELLHCNSDRTLLLAHDPGGNGLLVHKLWLRGSPDDAARECEWGLRLQHLDVVRYLRMETDVASGRPSVVMRFHEGVDLDNLVAQRGGLGAAEACRMLAPAARTLAQMHALRSADLPLGLCHGDIKPANLLRTAQTTLLLDFEHAGPTHQRPCAGTPGFAAPEAETGAPLHPSFDVFGLGAVLHWLLTGADARRRRVAAHDEQVQTLLSACLSPQPLARPSAADVAATLEELGHRLDAAPRETAVQALLAGDLDACSRWLSAHVDVALEQSLRRSRRLLQRVPGLLEQAAVAPDAGVEPAELTHRLAALTALARRLPLHRAIATARHRCKQAAAAALTNKLPSVFALVRAEQFAAARQLLLDLRSLAQRALAAPGYFAVPGDPGSRMPTLLQHSPLLCLDREQQRLDMAVTEHDELLASLHAAERELALDDANAAIEDIGRRYGGASEAVARYRDRLHRLGFYVERIARARSNIDRLHQLVPDESMTALQQFVDVCAAAMTQATATEPVGHASIGLRSLQLALGNLRDEFSALRERSAPGALCLDHLLARVTDDAWGLLAQAQQKLQAEPVPVRPLQLLLGRLDTLRVLEAFVDRPNHPRNSLVDRIEGLRLRLEQAQATRDRLARGAEQALAKGHWTTGLFDMERAVSHLQIDDDLDDRQAAQLRQRLEQARKRKQEIETNQRRYHELRARHAELQDAADSSVPERLQVLHDLRDCLQFLAMHANKDRSSLYGRDLRELELLMAQEQSAQAEAEVDVADGPHERLRLATAALHQVEKTASAGGPGQEVPGRLQRLLEHWQRRQQNEQREVDRRSADATGRQRRRRLAAAAATLMLVVSSVLVAVWPDAAAAATMPLLTAVDELPAALREPATALAQSAIAACRTESADTTTALGTVEQAIARFLQATSPQPAQAAFARRIWLHALANLRTRAHDGNDAVALEHAIDAATLRLREHGLP